MLWVIRIFDISFTIWIVEEALKIQNELLVDWWWRIPATKTVFAEELIILLIMFESKCLVL